MNHIYNLRHKIQMLKDFLQLLSTGPVTGSQISQTVGDFHDVIRRIGSISTLKVLIPDIPDVGDF